MVALVVGKDGVIADIHITEQMIILLNSGIFLTGGVSLLFGLDILLSGVTQLKATIAEKALCCVAKGCVMAMNYVATNKIYIGKGN